MFPKTKVRKRFLSLSSMTEKGAGVRFKGQFYKVFICEKLYIIEHKHGELYRLNLEPTSPALENEKAMKSPIKSLYHCVIIVMDILGMIISNYCMKSQWPWLKFDFKLSNWSKMLKLWNWKATPPTLSQQHLSFDLGIVGLVDVSAWAFYRCLISSFLLRVQFKA